jgi:GWxTD domain-containing protein
VVWGVPVSAAPPDRAERADVLVREARAEIARGTIEGRRAAMNRLEQAERLDPDRADITLDLARLYQRMGFLSQAREGFDRVLALHPKDRDALLGLSDIWFRDWLKYVDPQSLRLALEHRRSAAELAPRDADAWLGLVPLEVELGDLRAAMEMAERARAADPRRVDVQLALAHIAWRQGDAARADSLFRDGIPRLAASARRRYEDIAPVATERDTMGIGRLTRAERDELTRRFWADNDPDPSTPENEARLEYWSRVTQAYFLFWDPRLREWDQRGEVYVRYGPPTGVVYNPVGTPLSQSIFGLDATRINELFPVNVLQWEYPELGMVVRLEDRVLTGRYSSPVAMDRDTDPRPDADSLAAMADRFASAGGRGVFPVLPPHARALPVDGMVARMESPGGGPRLIGLLATPLAPGDSALATWVVLDSSRHEVARVARTLSPSACDPARLRVADFASILPPGDYLVGLGVRDGKGGRGALRAELTLEPPTASLALSDLIVSCGGAQVDPGAADAPPVIRLNPNPASVVSGGDPLVLYYEAYHLAAAADGLAHLEIEYTVRSLERDRRSLFQRVLAPRKPLPEVSARREERQLGDIRRQFVEVPVRSLPPGHYLVYVTIRDQTARSEATSSARFERR